MSRSMVRQAASLAINRENINRTLTLGHSHLTGSVMPENLEFFWQPPKPVFDMEKAKQLLAEAGYLNGLMRANIFVMPLTPIWAKRFSMTSKQSGFGHGFARSNGSRSPRVMQRRSSAKA